MINRRKPVHPGEVLREDIITPLGLDDNTLAIHHVIYKD